MIFLIHLLVEAFYEIVLNEAINTILSSTGIFRLLSIIKIYSGSLPLKKPPIWLFTIHIIKVEDPWIISFSLILVRVVNVITLIRSNTALLKQGAGAFHIATNWITDRNNSAYSIPPLPVCYRFRQTDSYITSKILSFWIADAISRELLIIIHMYYI